MVLKLFSNVHVGTNIETIDNIILNDNKIKSVIYVSDNDNLNKDIISISFGKTDESFYNSLDECLSYIHNSISRNENILMCCNDGYTEIVPIVIYYLIRSLNMNFYNAQNYVVNKISKNGEYSDKYLNKLRSKFIKSSLLE